MRSTFLTLDHFLIQHQAFWRFEPFFASLEATLPTTWQTHAPELCDWLNSLTDQQVEEYLQQPEMLVDVLARFVCGLSEALRLAQLPTLEADPNPLPAAFHVGIPGRKLQQIESMGTQAIAIHNSDEWLEWCSGKGFLGRVLSHHTQHPVTSVEYQQALCESGAAQSLALGINNQRFIQADVLQEGIDEVFHSRQHAVALHACGDLHQTLIKKVVAHQLPAVSLSPCCYHLTANSEYQPLSKVAQQSSLRLNRAELRIPLQQTVTGGERVKRHRQLEMSYRLGFDLLLRQQLGHEEYTPIPSIKKSALSQGFEPFCRWAADSKQIALPECDFAYYYALGLERFWHMEKLSLVQSLFKRPLEIWLVLDKSQFLAEAGYKVKLGEFCARNITPRNVLIQATKPAE